MMTLTEYKQEAVKIALTLGDDEFVRVVRVRTGMFAIERGIGDIHDQNLVWICSGLCARKGWYFIA